MVALCSDRGGGVPGESSEGSQGKMFRLAAAFIVLVGVALDRGPALAQQRLPTIPPDQYTADQKKASEEFLAARKAPLSGPFQPMMHRHRKGRDTDGHKATLFHI